MPGKRVNTKRRLREWEMNPFLFSFWQRMFHFERFEFLFSLAIPLLKISGLYKRGFKNSVNLRAHYLHFSHPLIPGSFDGYRILFVSDLHADKNQQAMERLLTLVQNLEFDLFLLGGDYRFKIHGLYEHALNYIERMLKTIKVKEGVYGVLGNHDPFDVVEPLEKMGVTTLLNEAVKLERKNQRIWLIGLDEAHFFENDDFNRAAKNVPQNEFRLVLCHSNDALLNIPPAGCHLFLSGHTHGGQICFPLIGPLTVHSRMPRHLASNFWRFNQIEGFTTTGVGTSGVPLRFNCPGEFVVIELHSRS